MSGIGEEKKPLFIRIIYKENVYRDRDRDRDRDSEQLITVSVSVSVYLIVAPPGIEPGSKV